MKDHVYFATAITTLVFTSVVGTVFVEKPPHPDAPGGVPGYASPWRETGFPFYATWVGPTMLVLWCFIGCAFRTYISKTKHDEWLNYRARRRLRGRIRMWNEAVDRLAPLSYASITVRRAARELEQNVQDVAERLRRYHSNDGLIYVWWGIIKQYKPRGLRSATIITKFPLKLLTQVKSLICLSMSKTEPVISKAWRRIRCAKRAADFMH